MTFREKTESSSSIASEAGSTGKLEAPLKTENEESNAKESEEDIRAGHIKVSLSSPTQNCKITFKLAVATKEGMRA